MTPREVDVVLQASIWQEEQAQQHMLSLAWHVSALQRQKRLQSLRSLLRPRSKARDVPISERRKEFSELKAVYDGYRARRSTDPDTGGAG
jgi:hypothetical protein